MRRQNKEEKIDGVPQEGEETEVASQEGEVTENEPQQ